VISSNHIDGGWISGAIPVHSNSRCDVPHANEQKYKKLVWEEPRKGWYMMLNDSSMLVHSIHKWMDMDMDKVREESLLTKLHSYSLAHP